MAEGAAVAERPAATDDRWKQAPVLPTLDRQGQRALRRAVVRANRAGMRLGVFAKVGDSNSDYPENLYGLGCRPVTFGEHRDLRAVHRRYTRIQFGRLASFSGCRPSNSFSRDSAAAVSGVWTEWLVTPIDQDGGVSYIPGSSECRPGQTPLGCELRLLRPRYATIMIGSNDVLLQRPLGSEMARNLARVVRTVRRFGAVPVLSTLPPIDEPGSERPEAAELETANATIWRVANRLNVPLINLWRALTAPDMVNQGLGPDNLHLGIYGGEGVPNFLRNAANLTEPALRHGANRRHLIWLQTLRRLDRVAQR